MNAKCIVCGKIIRNLTRKDRKYCDKCKNIVARNRLKWRLRRKCEICGSDCYGTRCNVCYFTKRRRILAKRGRHKKISKYYSIIEKEGGKK